TIATARTMGLLYSLNLSPSRARLPDFPYFSIRDSEMIIHRLSCSPLVSVCAAYREGRGEKFFGWKDVEGLRPKKLECLTSVPCVWHLTSNGVHCNYTVLTAREGGKAMKAHVIRIGN